MAQLKETLLRNSATIAQDFAGVTALAVIIFVGFSLPSIL